MNYTQSYAIRILIAFAIFLLLPTWGQAQPCECSNCPLPIQDNGSFDAFLDVNVNGPNDLGQCPLQSVCFTIDHTWIGDLSVTLTSPSNINYILMADANNSTGGCGTNEDDIDVCITLGSDSPLTNGTEYSCNNGGATPCIVGDWSVACNVTDPMTNATAAPNCNLNDFNVPGDPANGTWKLTINDVCAQDVGALETWSLVFACGVLDCFNCEADGGALNQADAAACQFSPDLNLGISPNYGGGTPPSSVDYGYVYVATDQASGNIENLFFNSNFVSLDPGLYDICGLSYILSDGGVLASYIGNPYTDLVADLAALSPPFCGDLSDDCFELEVGSPPLPTLLEVELCLGDCYTYNGVDYCAPGLYPVNFESYLGCDSLVNLTIFPLSESNVLIEETLCPGEIYLLGGEGYGPGIHYFNDTGENGCDSTTTLILNQLFVSANILDAPPITCSVPLVTLNSTGSVGSSFEWTDEDGNIISNQPIAVVSEPGCYTLTVSDTNGALSCSAVDEICVEEEIIFPSDPSISGPDELCFGDTISYFSTVDPDYLNFDWTVPAGVNILGGGDGFPSITVVWNSTQEGEVCLQVSNDCGPGNLICQSVEFLVALDAPDLSGATIVCASDTNVYTATLAGVDLYNWTLYGVGTIVGNSSTNTISVDWDTAGPAQLCASGVSDCGNGPVYCLDIEVGDVPQELQLNGPTVVCPQDTLDFYVSDYGNADSLSWVLPSCLTLIDPANTPSDTLSVLWDGACFSDSISVISYNNCGEGLTETLIVETIQIPIMNSIGVSDSYCQGETTVVNTELVSGINNYIWSSSNADIISGQGSSVVSVLWPSAGTAELCLQGEYSCGLTSISCVEVIIHAPASISFLGGDEEICLNGTGTYEAIDSSALSYIWTSSCGDILYGMNSSQIDVDWNNCPGGGTVCVQSVGICDTSIINCFDVNTQALPLIPEIVGPGEFCASDQILFSVEPDSNILSYNWDIPSCGMIQGSANTSEISLVFDETCPSTVICVSALDECGEGPEVCMDLIVNSAPEFGDIEGEENACIGEVQSFDIDPVNGAVYYNWTVTGGDIINGQGSNSIEVEWNDAGLAELCLFIQGECNEIVPDCKLVDVFPDMTGLLIQGADIVCDSSIVDYSILSIPGALSYVWTSSCGTIISNGNAAAIDIDWTGCPDGGQLCVYAQGNCNDGPLTCIDIEGGSIPLLGDLSGSDNSCQGATESYCADAEEASFYNWTVVGGTIVGANNTSCVDVVWSDFGNTQLCVQAENGCGLSTVNCFDVVVGQVPQTSPISGSISVCAGESALYTFDNSTLDYENVEWTLDGQCGVISGSSTEEVLDVIWGEAGACSVCVRLYNDCGESELVCMDVEVKALPDPNAGEDLTVCGLSVQLEDAQSGGGNIEWSFMGPGNLVFDDLSATKATVQADSYGDYMLFISEEINACSSVDTVIVSFNELPAFDGVVNYICDATADNYQVFFSTNGGLQPYQIAGVNGEWINQNTFLTDFIQSGSTYEISLTDNLDCGPVYMEGQHTCPCLSDAGSLLQDTTWLCENETLELELAQNAFLDGDDTFAYLISQDPLDLSNVQSAVLGQVNGNTIVKEPWMLNNTVYYITHIVADEQGGAPDLNDGCLDLSASTAFVFTAIPQAEFVEDTIILCEGDLLQVSFSIENTSCANILLGTDSGDSLLLSCVSSGDIIDIPVLPMGIHEIQISEVSNDLGCSSTSSSVLYVEVNAVPNLTIEASASVCNSEDTGQSTSINLEDFILEGDGPFIWENLSSCNFTGIMPLIDLNGVEPGEYEFAVSTSTAIAPCEDSKVYILLSVEDCECPNLTLSEPDVLCNTEAAIDLSSFLIENTTNINWTLEDSPSSNGFEPADISGNTLTFGGAAPGVYSIALQYIGTAPAGCALDNQLDLQVADQLSAGIATDEISFCLGTEELVDLYGLIDGEDASGVWTESSVNPSQDNAFDASTGQFLVNNQVSGVYSFNYSVVSEAPCLDQDTEVVVQIKELPVADAGLPGFISCADPNYDLEPFYNNDYLYSWSLNNVTLGSNPYYSATEVGTYLLEVEDISTGCTAEDSVEVEGFFTMPEMEIEVDEVKCFGESNGIISITNTFGGEEPYMYSFEGGPYSDELSYVELSSGTYTIAVEDIFGCTDSVEVFIGQPDPLELDIDFDYNEFENGILGLGDSISLDAYLNIDEDLIDAVQWSPAGLVNCDTCLSVVAYPDQTSILSLSVDVSTCNIRETVQILVNKEYPYYVPNMVSFNDDGINDVFYIYGGKEIERINIMQVYDRWGGMVFSNENFAPNDPSEGWTGKKLGRNAAAGVYAYFFEIQFIDGRVELVEGSITVRK